MFRVQHTFRIQQSCVFHPIVLTALFEDNVVVFLAVHLNKLFVIVCQSAGFVVAKYMTQITLGEVGVLVLDNFVVLSQNLLEIRC
jgi:hypothetical protein